MARRCRPRGNACTICARTVAELDIERANLSKALRDDIHEREAIIREAILAFESLSEIPVRKGGQSHHLRDGNGPQFEVHIEGQRSKGIADMQFCFDLMLTELSIKQGRGPGFLIHDTKIDATSGMPPLHYGELPLDMPLSGVYLFSEGGTHLYVGRSNNLRSRHGRHCGPGATHRQAASPFS